MKPSLLDQGSGRVLEIDGRTVVFEIDLVQVPVLRPFLAYRVLGSGGPKARGVLADVRRHAGSVREQFDDAELTRLYRVATRD
jgi:hypothetical protein